MGQSALALVILIGGIVIFSGITIVLLAMSSMNSGGALAFAYQSEAMALSGVQDALVHLIRNKDFTNEGGYCLPARTLPGCPYPSALITVAQSGGRATIVSRVAPPVYTSQSFRVLSSRGFRAIASVNASSGYVALVSIEPQ